MCQFVLNNEVPADNQAIISLHAKLFGPARFTRAAHLIRERAMHDLSLSYTIYNKDQLIGSIRLTPILIGPSKTLLLGPLAIDTFYHKQGLGRKLMQKALEVAKNTDFEAILLIGDIAYYSKFGFGILYNTEIILPAPTEPTRILGMELKEGALNNLKGTIKNV